MPIFKRSVSTLLLVLMALLAVGALTSTAIQMVGAFGRYSDSLETERLAAADKAIFHGVLSLRNNRGDAQSALLGEDIRAPSSVPPRRPSRPVMTLSLRRSPPSNSLATTSSRAH